MLREKYLSHPSLSQYRIDGIFSVVERATNEAVGLDGVRPTCLLRMPCVFCDSNIFPVPSTLSL